MRVSESFECQELGKVNEAFLKKPNFWLLHISGWLFYYLVLVFDNLFLFGSYNYFGYSIVYLLIPITLIGMLLTIPLRYLFRHCMHMRPLWLGIMILGVSALLSVLWTVPKNLLLHFARGEDVFALQTIPGFEWVHLFMMVSTSFFIIMVWCSLYFGINYHFRLVDAQGQRYQAARLSHLAQIRMLRYQINPHFLFNSLNAVSTLVMRDDKQRCNRMLSQLSTFLRFSLDTDPEKKIRLHEEISALMLYLDIEKTRFGERLEVKLHVHPDAEFALVPSLLIQPLIENAIKHAIAKMSRGGKIVVEAWVVDAHLYLQVEDNGPLTELSEVNQEGVGLQNITDRLQVLYQDKQSLKLYVVDPNGFGVRISLPFEQN
ncbi:histidine kinase [Bowmanella pacifica]|uniref:Histidine kinase n=1 Tax=Bowmanella pacifica TaxID=502051 RepID=A0A917YRP4_9ALTE|nr:histidine kinase [Bowmanella pacifica]